MIRISAKTRSVSCGKEMAICFIIECDVADKKVPFLIVICTFGVEEWRSKIVRILTGGFLGFLLANFVVLLATAPPSIPSKFTESNHHWTLPYITCDLSHCNLVLPGVV